MPESLISNRVRYGFLLSYLVILATGIVLGSMHLQSNPGSYTVRFVVFGIISLLLMIVGAIMGAISKKQSANHVGNWDCTTMLMSMDEYEQARKKHEADFKVFYDDMSSASGLCCTIFAPYLFYLAMALVEDEFDPAFWYTPGAILVIFLGYILLGLASYGIGYFSVKFGVGDFFIRPDNRSAKYAKLLDSLDTIMVKAFVKVGRQEDLQALFEEEWRAYIPDLPDSVYIQIKVEEAYIYDYPYLVGIIVNGPTLTERTEELALETRFPAIIEYSSDTKASVLVSRFEIPSDESKLEYEPNITSREFVLLGTALAQKLREIVVT